MSSVYTIEFTRYFGINLLIYSSFLCIDSKLKPVSNMKRLSIILGICFLFFGISTSYAQLVHEKAEKMVLRRGDIKGPNAKNIKPGVYKSSTLVFAKNIDRTPVKGPKAKNQKAWKRNENVPTLAVIGNNKRTQLKGPSAKNYEPWKR